MRNIVKSPPQTLSVGEVAALENHLKTRVGIRETFFKVLYDALRTDGESE